MRLAGDPVLDGPHVVLLFRPTRRCPSWPYGVDLRHGHHRADPEPAPRAAAGVRDARGARPTTPDGLAAVWERLDDPARGARRGRGAVLLPAAAARSARAAATRTAPTSETEDAIKDHNEIRDAIAEAAQARGRHRRLVGGGPGRRRGQQRPHGRGGARGPRRLPPARRPADPARHRGRSSSSTRTSTRRASRRRTRTRTPTSPSTAELPGRGPTLQENSPPTSGGSGAPLPRTAARHLAGDHRRRRGHQGPVLARRRRPIFFVATAAIGWNKREKKALPPGADQLRPRSSGRDDAEPRSRAVSRTMAVRDRAPHLSTRSAAFIGVGAMVGAGIFALLGAAGEVAGAAVWISFLIAGGSPPAGLLVRQVRGALSVGGRPARVRRPRVRRRPRHRHHRVAVCWPPTRSSRRWSRCRSAVTPAVPSPTAARPGRRCSPSLVIAGDDRCSTSSARRRWRGCRPSSSSWCSASSRCSPSSTLVEPRPDPPGVLGLPVGARHRLQRGPDVLRVPRVRRHHLHGEGPRRPRPPAAPGDVPGARHRDGRSTSRWRSACSAR